MSTTYGKLPIVPQGRWDFRILTVDQSEDDEGTINATLHTVVSAVTAESAEERALAVVDKDYQDDLRGSVATAMRSVSADRWAVDIVMAPYR